MGAGSVRRRVKSKRKDDSYEAEGNGLNTWEKGKRFSKYRICRKVLSYKNQRAK